MRIAIDRLRSVWPSQMEVSANRTRRGRSGSLQMIGSMRRSGKPSPPVTQYLSFKAFAVANGRQSRGGLRAMPML
jgi:hypothetical protein